MWSSRQASKFNIVLHWFPASSRIGILWLIVSPIINTIENVYDDIAWNNEKDITMYVYRFFAR